jgi:acetylornithine/succinyldiaminopimelate/putrescine aminotransferase/predicted amino acid dehydrogenase
MATINLANRPAMHNTRSVLVLGLKIAYYCRSTIVLGCLPCNHLSFVLLVLVVLVATLVSVMSIPVVEEPDKNCGSGDDTASDTTSATGDDLVMTVESKSKTPEDVMLTTSTSSLPTCTRKKGKAYFLSPNAIMKAIMNHVIKWVMKFFGAFLQSKAGAWLMKTKVVKKVVDSGAASSVLGKLPPGTASLMAQLMKADAPPIYTMPYFTELSRMSKLDREYYAGTGDRLWCTDRFGQPQQVIDFVGGYGANLLGHNHPEIKEAVLKFHQSPAIAISDQGSIRLRGEHALAYQLSQMVGEHTGEQEYMVRFANTGSEAVEMALAHACLEREQKVLAFLTQQRLEFAAYVPDQLEEIEAEVHRALNAEKTKVVTLKGAYHGKTLGARSLIGNPAIRNSFKPMMGIDPIVIPINSSADAVDVDAIVQREMVTVPALQWNKETGRPEKTTFSFSRIVAAIAEPILGEGGVCLPNRNLLARLSGYEFPVVFDEIQCGLGRSGQFLASQGLHGDYYIFAKALGGGVAKISALLVARDRYIPRFDNLYSSTFAGDNFSCAIAQEVLKIIKRDNIPQRAQERGEVLKRRCRDLQKKFPRIIKGVSGQGLMLGVEINPEIVEDALTLRIFHTGDRLGWCAASYLLNRQNLRVNPTLSAPNVLRLEPSVFIDDQAIDALVNGVTEMCEAIQKNDVLHLFGYVLDEALVHREKLETPPMKLPPFSSKIEQPHPDAQRVVFISHNFSPEVELEWMHPDWRALNPIARVELMRQMATVVDYKPTAGNAQNILNNKVWFLNVMVPFDAVQMALITTSEERANVIRSLEQALEVGRSYGCTVGVLGGFNSIVSGNGMSLRVPPGMRVTTGNSFTVAVGMRRLQDSCVEQKIDLRDPATRVAIVGATGNIGHSIAQQIVRKFPVTRLTLISRSMDKLERMKQQLISLNQEKGEGAPTYDIKVSTDVADMSECNIIVVATATGKPIVFPQHLHPEREILLADLSVPSSVSREALAMPNLKKIPIGGTVTVPGEPHYVLHPLLEPGTVFCCSAEGMLLSLEPEKTAGLIVRGDIEQAAVDMLEELGDHYNFFAKLGEATFRPPDLTR